MCVCGRLAGVQRGRVLTTRSQGQAMHVGLAGHHIFYALLDSTDS
jgi:hypothetical protein